MSTIDTPLVVNDETFQYVYGLGRIAQVGSGATFYYLTDGLGSTMTLRDEEGDVDTTWDHDVFGDVRGISGSQPQRLHVERGLRKEGSSWSPLLPTPAVCG
jgi:hypothetical protein